MIRRTTMAAATAVAATVLPACGGATAPDPRAEIEIALRSFGRAIVARDGRAGCALMTPELRTALAGEEASDRDRLCATMFGFLSGMWTEDERQALDHVTVRRVRADGDRAELHDDDVELARDDEPDPDPRPMVWRRVDEKWLIEDLG